MTEACKLTSPSRGNKIVKSSSEGTFDGQICWDTKYPYPRSAPLHVGLQDGTDTLAIDNTGRESEAKERRLREVFQFCYV